MLFMGMDQIIFEWRYDDQLEWNVLEIDKHKRLHQYVKDLNHFYMENKALWELDTSWTASVIMTVKQLFFPIYDAGNTRADNVVVVANHTCRKTDI